MSGSTMRTPGWYTDPRDGASLRWWDGSRWSAHTQPIPGSVIVEQAATTTPTVITEPAANAQISVVRDAAPGAASGSQTLESAAATSPEVPGDPPPSAGGHEEPAGRRWRRLVALLLAACLLLGGVSAWFWWLKPQASSSQTATNSDPDPASGLVADNPGVAQMAAPAACNDVVGALTADGTSDLVSTQLQSAAAGGELSESASFFASIGPVTNDVMANSGAACVAAVNAGQGPAAYANFVNVFGSAMSVGTSTINVGLSQPGGLTDPQKAELGKLAADLAAATSAVAKDASSAPGDPAAG